MDPSNIQERYRAVLQAARNLFSLTTPQDLIEQVLKHSHVMMEADVCSIYLPDPATKELILYSARGAEDVADGIRIPWDKGIAGWVFQEWKEVWLEDAANDPRRMHVLDEDKAIIPHAMLCTPLMDRGVCFGVLQVFNPIGRPDFTPFDHEIFGALASVVTSARVRYDREQQIQKEQALDRELKLAVEIQRSFLPPETFLTPRSELRVCYQPARVIGGDFYAAIPLPDEKLLFALGDVSGKGIPAALTTAQISAEMNIMLNVAEEGLAPYVFALNNSLCQRLAAGRFAATTFLLHDPLQETMEVVCAGQFPPWRWRQDTWEQLKLPSFMPLGISSGLPYEAVKISCQAGEKWLCYTDGIPEGRNRTGEEYTQDRLQKILSSGSAAHVLKKTWQSWLDFLEETKLHDDACLSLLLTKPAASIELVSIARECKMGRNFIEEWALTAGFNDLERGRIVLAADEAVTNVIRHTYQCAQGKPIQLSANVDQEKLELILRDFGPPLDPATLKSRKLEEVRPGGLGLHLLHTVFTEVEHRPLPDGNSWRLALPLP